MAGNTGPTSPAGKAKVSRNALKHGLRASKSLSPQEQKDFEALAANLYTEYRLSLLRDWNGANIARDGVLSLAGINWNLTPISPISPISPCKIIQLNGAFYPFCR